MDQHSRPIEEFEFQNIDDYFRDVQSFYIDVLFHE